VIEPRDQPPSVSVHDVRDLRPAGGARIFYGQERGPWWHRAAINVQAASSVRLRRALVVLRLADRHRSAGDPLAQAFDLSVVDQSSASWNRVSSWLHQVERVRQA
jgi:hypothetical protein